MQMIPFIFFMFIPVCLWGLGNEMGGCLTCEYTPTNEIYVLISSEEDTPDIVSNRISQLSFLNEEQIADAWRLYYSASFNDETPYCAMIRFNRGTESFHYSAKYLAMKDFTPFAGIPIGGLDIFMATHLEDISGPDYSPLEIICLDFTAVSNLVALGSASNLTDVIIYESCISSLDFLVNKPKLGRIVLCDIPVKDSIRIESAIRNHPTNAPNLYVSIRSTLINDFRKLKEAANGKGNVFLHMDGTRFKKSEAIH